MRVKICVPTGTVVGIGKFKVFKIEGVPCELPTLSFIVAKENNIYTATCLHLLLDSYGLTEKEAIDRLAKECTSFLQSIFKESAEMAWHQLHELETSDVSVEFWNAYREVQLNLAEKGIDTKSSYVKYLEKQVKELTDKINELKEQKETENVLNVVSYEPAA